MYKYVSCHNYDAIQLRGMQVFTYAGECRYSHMTEWRNRMWLKTEASLPFHSLFRGLSAFSPILMTRKWGKMTHMSIFVLSQFACASRETLLASRWKQPPSLEGSILGIPVHQRPVHQRPCDASPMISPVVSNQSVEIPPWTNPVNFPPSFHRASL